MNSPFFRNVSLQDVLLYVQSLRKAMAFYVDILGLRVISNTSERAELSATGELPALLILEEHPKAPLRLIGTTGLFHVALLYPDRQSLADATLRLIDRRCPLEGASDHGVSEAIYLADTERNGIELYVDRSPDTWPRSGAFVNMVTNPLDVENLLTLATSSNDRYALHPETLIGHIHLNVLDLDQTKNVLSNQLGLSIRQRNYPGALFFGYDGYHHHLAANTWGIRSPALPGSLGLKSFKLCRQGDAAVQRNHSVVQLENVQIHFATDDRLPSG